MFVQLEAESDRFERGIARICDGCRGLECLDGNEICHPQHFLLPSAVSQVENIRSFCYRNTVPCVQWVKRNDLRPCPSVTSTLPLSPPTPFSLLLDPAGSKRSGDCRCELRFWGSGDYSLGTPFPQGCDRAVVASGSSGQRKSSYRYPSPTHETTAIVCVLCHGKFCCQARVCTDLSDSHFCHHKIVHRFTLFAGAAVPYNSTI